MVIHGCTRKFTIDNLKIIHIYFLPFKGTLQNSKEKNLSKITD